MDSRKSLRNLLTSTSVLALVAAGTAPAHALGTGITYAGVHNTALPTNGGSHSYIYITGVTGSPSPSFTNNGTIGPNTTRPSLEINNSVLGAVVNDDNIFGGGTDNDTAIYVLNSTLAGGLLNAGTVSAGADTDGATNVVVTGIAIEGTSSITGNLNNTALISAQVSGTVAGRPLHLAATGIYAGGATFNGNILNSGALTARSVAYDATDIHADAAAIWVAGPLSGSVANSDGTISAYAEAAEGGSLNAAATGILVSAATVSGGIYNYSTIDARAQAFDGYAAQAHAEGIYIDPANFSGGIVNIAGADITAVAQANHADSANAGATGIAVLANSFSGGITNGGLVRAFATASHAYAAEAYAAGMFVNASQFSNGIANEGTVYGVARVYDATTATAIAAGIAVRGKSFNGGVSNAGFVGAYATAIDAYAGSAYAGGISVAGSQFSGGIQNSGMVDAYATAKDAYAAHASATGIYVDAAQFNNGIVLNHGGQILGAAQATDALSAQAYGAGIYVIAPQFTGGISNSGFVEGAALAANAGTAIANAAGIYLDASQFTGGIVNQGGTIQALACAYGVSDNGCNPLGTVNTTGFAQADAAGIAISGGSFSGGITNEPVPNNPLSVALIWTDARAGNAEVATAQATAIYVDAANFYGGHIGIDNLGTITAYANASTAVQATAIARGIFVNRTTSFTGGLTNGGTINTVAEVQNSFIAPESAPKSFAQATGVAFTVGSSVGGNGIVNNPGAVVSGLAEIFTYAGTSAVIGSFQATALARGLSFSVGTSDGGISNAGTVSATAQNTLGLWVYDSIFNASVKSTATGVLITGGVLAGDLDNLNSGTIQASAGVQGTIDAVWSDSSVFSLGADAVGINVTGSTSTTGVAPLAVNGGTITAGASVDVTIDDENGFSGYPNAYVITADATGIHIGAPKAAGGILNSGLIAATASAVPTITASLSEGDSYSLSADAEGIKVNGTSFSGGITNSAGGTISAIAMAGPAALVVHGSSAIAHFNVAAYASGIDIDPANFSGGITNAGKIMVTATAGMGSATITGGDGFVALPTFLADASGILVQNASFAGGITNSGIISVSASASGGTSVPAQKATAYALGIDLWYPDSFSGPIIAMSGGTISVTAYADAVTANASANGIAVYSDRKFTSTISNGGTIQASAMANGVPVALGGSNVEAYAAGILVVAPTFTGGITNSGSINASATATEEISLSGSEEQVTRNVAQATGIAYYGSTFSGGITNSGSVGVSTSNTGSATINAGSDDHINQVIWATGVDAGGTSALYHDKHVVLTFSGGITNSGTITAVVANTMTGDLANGDGNDIKTGAQAFGIFMDVGDFDYVNNSKTISATVQNTLGVTLAGGTGNWAWGYADAYGVQIDANSFASGSVTNSGTITSGATNGVSANFSNGSGFGVYGVVRAAGIAVGTGTSINQGALTGTITSPVSNSGTIAALATDTVSADFKATGVNYLYGAAIATGVQITAHHLTNSVANTGSGLISAGAVSNIGTLTSAGGSIGSVSLYATAGGIAEAGTGTTETIATTRGSGFQFILGKGSHLTASVTNSVGATIDATAKAQAGAYDASANAQAYGILLLGDTVAGTVSNAGVIEALAKATGTVANATAAGVRILAGAYARGVVTNTGTLSAIYGDAYASGTGTGPADANAYGINVTAEDGGEVVVNISNAGTIAAYASASGAGTSGEAYAAGINADSSNGNTVATATLAKTSLIAATAIDVLNAKFSGASRKATGTAQAIAVNLRGFDLSLAGVTNSGAISASAETVLNATFSASNQAVRGIAQATGISVYGNSVNPAGSASAISNSGTISAVSISNIGTISGHSGSSATAEAEASGIDIDATYFSGTIGNSLGGLILAQAIAHAPGTEAQASAAGIHIGARSLSAAVFNDGSIEGIASAGFVTNDTTAAAASATAAGILIHGASVTAGVGNYGTISAILGEALAYGTRAAQASAIGVEINGSTVFAGVENQGTISGIAVGIGTSGASANAQGVSLSGDTLVAALANFGQHALIVGSASATAHNARAQGTGVALNAGTIQAAIYNSGTIKGNAEASSGNWTSTGSDGSVSASANGLLIAGQSVLATEGLSGNFAYPVALDPAGPGTTGIVNTGQIDADATATGNLTINTEAEPTFTFEARSVGINIDASDSFTGAIINDGLINASAWSVPAVTVAGGTNAISADAKAHGVDIHAQSVSGGINNSGTISALAEANPNVTIANGEGTLSASAEAYGVKANAEYWSGGVTNSALISASATASATPSFGEELAVIPAGGVTTITGTWGAEAFAKARGLDMYGYGDSATISGGLSNGTGATISARAVAIAKGSDGYTAQSANAIGVKITTGTFGGGITNSGNISAYAQAGTTNAVVLAGVIEGGVQNQGGVGGAIVEVGSYTYAHAQAQGLVVNAASFTGDIVNHGTISATAAAWGGYAQATGIALNTKTAWGKDGGVVTNSGLILAQADSVHAGTAAGIRVGSGSISPGTINNTGVIEGVWEFNPNTYDAKISQYTSAGIVTATAIDLSGAAETGKGTTINLDPGQTPADNVNSWGPNPSATRIIGNIDLSAANPDTVNVYGGYLNGSIIGGGLESGGSVPGIDADVVTPATTVLGSSGQTVNINLASGADYLFFGFTPENEGAVLGTNPYNQFYNTWADDTIENVGKVNLEQGILVLSPDASMSGVGTLTISAGTTTWVDYVTAPTNTKAGVGTNGNAPTISVGTINIGAGTPFYAFETPGYYAWTNLYAGAFSYTTTNGTSFASVNSYSPLFEASLGTWPAAGGDTTLTLTRVAFGAVPGLDGKEQGFGNLLEQQYETKASDLTALEDLFVLTPAQYQKFMSVVDNEVEMQVWQPLVDVWDNFESMITDRLAGHGGTPFAGMPSLNGAIGKGSVNLASMADQLSDAGSPLGSGAQTQASGGQAYGLWGRGYGIFSNGANTGVMTGFSQNTGGVIGGFDMAVARNLVLGGAVDYSHGSMSLNDGSGHGSTNQYQVALYGRYDAKPWYVNGVAGGGWGQYNQSRDVNSLLPNIGTDGQILTPIPVVGTATANYGANEFAAYGEAGYNYRVSQYVLQPLLGLGYLHSSFGGFTETGAGMGDLTVDPTSADSLISTLGGRATTTFSLAGGGKLTPSVLAAWQHQFLDTAMTLSESLASSPYAGFFSEKGPDYGRDGGLLGVGVEGDFWTGARLFLDYNAKLDGSYTVQAVSAGLRLGF